MCRLYIMKQPDNTEVVFVPERTIELAKHHDMNLLEVHGHDYKTVKLWMETHIQKNKGSSSSENAKFERRLLTVFTEMFRFPKGKKCFSNYSVTKTYYVPIHTNVELYGETPVELLKMPYNPELCKLENLLSGSSKPSDADLIIQVAKAFGMKVDIL